MTAIDSVQGTVQDKSDFHEAAAVNAAEDDLDQIDGVNLPD